jgi:hypothetical protein
MKRTRQQGGLKRLLQLIFDPTTRQIAAAIRLGERKERNRAIRAAQCKPDVWIDKALQAQAQAQISTYEPPERTTDKPMIFPNPHGRYFQEQRKSFEKTHLLPTFKRPLQDEPPMTLDMTQVRIPTWLL